MERFHLLHLFAHSNVPQPCSPGTHTRHQARLWGMRGWGGWWRNRGDQVERDVDLISPSQENYPMTRAIFSEALKDQQDPEKFYNRDAKKRYASEQRSTWERAQRPHTHTQHKDPLQCECKVSRKHSRTQQGASGQVSAALGFQSKGFP